MKKLGIVVLGVAAVATITGCKDPDYKRGAGEPQNEVKTVTTATEVKTVEPAPVVVEEKTCTCAPGTKHAKPCACGAANCLCVVEVKPLPPPPPPAPAVVAAEPEYTIYTVQSGDYLAKISRKYNVTIAAIKKANPSIKGDVVRVGQKLKLPGKFDVPAAAEVKAAPKAAKVYAPYTGATKEYVVKSGDTLGAIAYGNGINIRQLKELNGLSKDTLRVGQKLKIPAEKVVKTAAPAPAKGKDLKPAKPVVKPVEKKAAEKVEKPIVEAPKEAEAKPAVEAPVVAPEAPTVAAEETAKAGEGTYVVQEGDDMTGVSIAFGVTPAAIRELNNLSDNEQLKPGQVIKLPADAQQ